MSKRRFPGIHQLPLVIIKLSSAVRAKTGLPAPPLYNAELHCMQMQKKGTCANAHTQTQIHKHKYNIQIHFNKYKNRSRIASPSSLYCRTAVRARALMVLPSEWL